MNRTRNRVQLVLLAVLFVAPLAAAVVVYFVAPQWLPEGRLNHGTLIEPARAVPQMAFVDAAGASRADALRGKWTLVQVGTAACDAACEERLAMTRQVRLALNQNRTRVQRLYVVPDGALTAVHAQLAAAHPDLVLVADRGAPGARAVDFFAPPTPNALYLVDPVGNWLMVYTGAVEPKGLHKDLKKLLRFSQIG